MKTGYELGYPSLQNAIDIIPDWTSYFPPATGVKAGGMDLFNDPRITWALEQFGDVKGKNVLEIGPLEGAHTATLSKAGALVDSIEANRAAYLKCLITKEIMQIQNARFYLGDCVQWIEKPPKAYALVVACGVLYHMHDPLRFLRALSKMTDELYLWTVYIDKEIWSTVKQEQFGDIQVQLHELVYGEKDFKFCGGGLPTANWMKKSDILAVLRHLGYDDLRTAHDETRLNEYRPATLSIYARRTTPRSRTP